MAEQTALERQDVVVPGDRSELRLEAGHIVVHKEATTQAEPTEVGFRVAKVRGATLNPPTRSQLGWLHVSVVGGSPPPPSGLAALGDPYTLPLTPRGVGAARRLVRMVEKHVRARGMPSEAAAPAHSTGVIVNPDVPPPPPPPPPAAPTPVEPGPDPEEQGGDDLVARLRELADLHAAGALTDDEFRRAKERLLA